LGRRFSNELDVLEKLRVISENPKANKRDRNLVGYLSKSKNPKWDYTKSPFGELNESKDKEDGLP
jgi:hypothetical protein